MRYHVLATDYDGTIATTAQSTARPSMRCASCSRPAAGSCSSPAASWPTCSSVCPHLDLFERVVAENGALLYRPATKRETAARRAAARGVRRRAASGAASRRSRSGAAIVATGSRTRHAVLEAIRELGLELQVIFNKGAVMVLPSGVNKATGLAAALDELGLSPHNVVGVGDAENDHAFLKLCECSAAVANALPALKDDADLVTARRPRRRRRRADRRARSSTDLAAPRAGPSATASRSARATTATVALEPYGDAC